MLLRKGVKTIAFGAGGLQSARPDDLSVLVYHRIGQGEGEISTPISLFERQLSWLARRGNVMALDAALADGSGGIVLTFDDGYRDFVEVVVPLLVQHRLPALLYLATGLISNDDPDRLRWSDLRDAVGTGLITVGSHTHSHADLSRVGEDEAMSEMQRSKDLIEDELEVACRHFAYPWAVGSAAADRVARRLFASAAREAWQLNRHGSIDPHRLGRTPVLRSDGTFFFRAKARGQMDHEAIAYRLLRRGPWRPTEAPDPLRSAT
jgi:peptidoglycan/xylan/chitin deacetylase (PgdA/CDA1 family)